MATPPVPAAAAKTAGKKGIGAWYAGHKPEALLGAAGIVVTLALYVKSKNAAAGSGTSSTATPSTSTVMPGTLAPDTGSSGSGGGDISGLEGILSGLGQQLTQLQGQQGSGNGTPGTPAAPAPAEAPRTFGQGIVSTAQGEMVWLGTTGAGGSTAGDYQVGGGAPVYFGNSQTLAQGGTQAAGVDVYTPVGYENLVSQKAGA